MSLCVVTKTVFTYFFMSLGFFYSFRLIGRGMKAAAASIRRV